MMNTSEQFAYSYLLGLISSGIHLGSSYVLDKVTNYDLSNIIGLLVGRIVNFSLQQKLFTGNTQNSGKYLLRFGIGNIIIAIFSQVLFVKINSHIKRTNYTYYKGKYKKDVSWIRYIISVITFIFVSFPLRKYYIFV